LVIVSAGNVDDPEDWLNYPAANLLASVENPSQAWNALIVGGYTQRTLISDANYNNYTPLSRPGGLSPFSTTSHSWKRTWPVKPDVVFEGGNLVSNPEGDISLHDDLDLLSTSKSFNLNPFQTINATSAAAAQASFFAARLAAEYPDAWPETIRALTIHSASWTPEMLRQLAVAPGSPRSAYDNLIRVFGYGVPNLERALRNTQNTFTLIAQETIQPFGYNSNNQPETNEMHFYPLPWPKDLLLSMGSTPATLRITLSYFIEPGAGQIGWKDRYRYPSHGLRFDINNPQEEEQAFRMRVNAASREENDDLTHTSGSQRWTVGVNNRNGGSVHSDSWEATAAELATCNHIAVYPVIGWWRERSHLHKVDSVARYSLIVSLETPAQEVELYNTIQSLIATEIQIRTR
jgi:hypothetical protein